MKSHSKMLQKERVVCRLCPPKRVIVTINGERIFIDEITFNNEYRLNQHIKKKHNGNLL